jgi:hypothetical protein
VAAVIDVPFGADRSPRVKRDPRFLDLQDEIEDMLCTPDPDTSDANSPDSPGHERTVPV